MKNSLGNKLTVLRKQKKYTQEAAAELLGVTRQTISNWELNQTKPDIIQIKSISNLYQISVDELIDNNTKDILTTKISNVEKLTGLVYKILIGLLIIFSMLLVIYVLYFFFGVKTVGYGVQGNLYLCSLNEVTYDITLWSEPIYSNTINTGDGYIVDDIQITPYINIPNLEKYQKHYQLKNLIFSFFEEKGGHCMK